MYKKHNELTVIVEILITIFGHVILYQKLLTIENVPVFKRSITYLVTSRHYMYNILFKFFRNYNDTSYRKHLINLYQIFMKIFFEQHD